MAAICSIGIKLFIAIYLVALALFLIGTFGWFGQERDPLSGIFLLPLGLPWNRMLAGAPEPLLPWVGVCAPIINILILQLLCRRLNG